HLDRELRLQDVAAEARPLRGAAELGKEQSDVEKAQPLAGEMRVRAVVNRVEALDVPGMVPQREEKATHTSWCPRSRLTRQRPDPAPCDRAECDLEAAGPVDPDPIRVFIDPRLEEGEEPLDGRFASVEIVALRQPQEMVVPAQL